MFDGIARHTAEGYAFQRARREAGFREAVRERDEPFGDVGRSTLQGLTLICDRWRVAIIRVSRPLGRELQRVFPSRPFHVRFWDGGAVGGDRADGAPTFFVRRPSALAHFLSAPGTLGLGRAYVDGSLAVDDLDARASSWSTTGSRRR